MALLDLFYVASLPVIKILLVTALGLFLALENINLLGKDARKLVNHLVYYVFNTSLVSSKLAETITSENVALLWYMPINILATVIIGSALGWVLIRITRPPKVLEGLILGVCSAGNLGNLPIIIVPAICKDKGSPFGDPDVCYNNGMAYASSSMALGAIFIWSYVYNIMRVSSNQVHKKGIKRSDSLKLEASGEVVKEENAEVHNPAEDNVDSAYTMLLPSTETESEEKAKVSIPARIKQQLTAITSHFNFQAIFSPSTLGALAGFVIGVVTPIRNLMIGSNAPLRVVEDSVAMLGDAAIPTTILIMGANLLTGLKGTGIPVWTMVGIIAVRYVFLPILGVLVIKGVTMLGWVRSDPLYQFMLLLQYALPPAMNIGTIAQLFGAGESECSVIMLWTYLLASVAVTLWSTYFMWLVSH